MYSQVYENRARKKIYSRFIRKKKLMFYSSQHLFLCSAIETSFSLTDFLSICDT